MVACVNFDSADSLATVFCAGDPVPTFFASMIFRFGAGFGICSSVSSEPNLCAVAGICGEGISIGPRSSN